MISCWICALKPPPVRPARSAAELQLPPNICTYSTLSPPPPPLLTLACTAVTAQRSSRVHAGIRAMCSGHKSAAAAAGTPTPLLLRFPPSCPAGRERSPPAAAGCTQRCRTVAAPRCTEPAYLLLLNRVTPS